MSVLTVMPKFLYPCSRQFPFDETAEEIVRAIEKRNWKVPGITVEFRTNGSGEEKYQKVQYIAGDNFKLYFFRGQGNFDDGSHNSAALETICIPKQMIEVYEDESGPMYYLYVGKNWEADKEWFMNSIKINAKLFKEPRRYLVYHGKHNAVSRRAKELVAYGNFGREYSPIGDEPFWIDLEQKFNEFTTWLKENVLDYILTFPEADVIQPPTPMEELIPYEGPWETIFSICGSSDAGRIEIGKIDPKLLIPSARHAYFGKSNRLVSLSIQNKGKFPNVAYDGFIWCDVNQEGNVTKNSKFVDEVRSEMSPYPYFSSWYIVAIKLKYANGVYVADNSKYEETREKLFEAIAPRERLTDEELNSAIAERGATIVPVTEYKGNYKEPIVLINRELDFDEIDWIKEVKNLDE